MTMPETARTPTGSHGSRPGLGLVGTLVIAVGVTIVIAAVVTAIVGAKATNPATTRPHAQASGTVPDAAPDDTAAPSGSAGDSDWQTVTAKGGAISFEAPSKWTTQVDVSGDAGGEKVVGAGAVATTLDDYKAATTGGIVAVVTGPTTATSAALTGATIGNSTIFCPPTRCTTGKPQELDKQLDSSVTQTRSQFTFSEPATDTSAGEFRYTIETANPTRYVVVIVRAVDPAEGADALEHALSTLKLG